MPLIQKPNYNQIFASQAPDQDKPAVFNNYPLGWGPESRPNNGKPTIKGFNYLQQTSDLKDLWILQNGACLPYDESIEYAEGAPVLKDGVIQYKTADGFSPAISEKPYILKYFTEGVLYPLNARAMLENGDIVKSTVDGNTANPNADMTGWVNPKTEQQKINSKIRKTPYDFGGLGGDNDDTLAVKACIESGYALILDEHKVSPFEVQDNQLDVVFSKNAKLIIQNSNLQDSITFLRCSGEIHGINVEEPSSDGSYVTVVANWCEDLDFYRPRIEEGKITGLLIANSTNTHAHSGVGKSSKKQSWYIISSINSTMNYCYLNSSEAGFFIIGKGYKSGTRNWAQIDEHLTMGMSMNYCYAAVPSLGFDINGAIGATLNHCITNQNWAVSTSACFQVKQSTNIPEETKRLTSKNRVIGCIAINCNRGFATQNGEDVLFKDNFVFGSKHNAVTLNDTPRVTIDGLYCYDLFQQNVSSPASDTGADTSIVKAKNPSHSCIVKNVELHQNIVPEDITQVNLFDFDGEGCILDNIRISTSSLIGGSSGNKFNTFCRNKGLHFTYGNNLKIGGVSNYLKIIDDQTNSAIYPLVYTKQIDLSTLTTGTSYFDGIPERGMVVGKVRFHAIGTPTNAKIALGSQSAVTTVLPLTDVASGVNNYNPVDQVINISQALAYRHEITAPATGRVFIQLRGISLI